MPSIKLYRDIWSLAWPIIIASLSVPLLGFVDTAILGHLPDPHHLGGVAIGAIVFDVLMWTFAFLRMGTTGVLSQALGRGDYDKVRPLLGQSLVLAAVLGCLPILACYPLLSLVDGFMQASPEVTGAYHSYILIRIFAVPAALGTYVFIGYFIASRHTRWVLLQTLLTGLLNLVLDYVLVVHAGMRADGVALGTLLAQYTNLGIAAYLTRRSLRGAPGIFDRTAIASIKAYLPLLTLNRHLFVRTLCLLLTLLFFYAQSAQQGDVALAANSILFMLVLSVALGLDGFANAVEALVGRALSQGDTRLFHQINLAAAGCCLLTAALYSGILFIAQQPLLRLLTDIPAVVAMASTYYIWVVWLPLLNCWSFLLDGIFIGSLKTPAMQNTMFVSALLFFCIWYATQAWGNQGLWLALTSLFLSRALTLGSVYAYYSTRSKWSTSV